MNHQVGRWVFAVTVGVLVAFMSYRWITNPAPRAERMQEEAIVMASREHLTRITGVSRPELVDPLEPDRDVGKVYIYQEGAGWEVSGYYRRDEDDEWHPYLLTMDAAANATGLKVQDPALAGRDEALLEVLP